MCSLVHRRGWVEREPAAAFDLTAQHVMKLQLKLSQTPECLLGWLQPWLQASSSPSMLQVSTSIPQILPETQNSHGLAKKKRKDNFTATTTAAHCPGHIPEGHLQSPIPETLSWAHPRLHLCKYEWIANEELSGLETGDGLPYDLAADSVIEQPWLWLFDTHVRQAHRFLCMLEYWGAALLQM